MRNEGVTGGEAKSSPAVRPSLFPDIRQRCFDPVSIVLSQLSLASLPSPVDNFLKGANTCFLGVQVAHVSCVSAICLPPRLLQDGRGDDGQVLPPPPSARSRPHLLAALRRREIIS